MPSKRRKTAAAIDAAEAPALSPARADSDADSGDGEASRDAEPAEDDSDQWPEPGDNAAEGDNSAGSEDGSDDGGGMDFDPEIVEDPRKGIEVTLLLSDQLVMLILPYATICAPC